MYALLTGSMLYNIESRYYRTVPFISIRLFNLHILYPFYDLKEQDVSNQVTKGLTAFIDPHYKNRTIAEAKLAEIIPQCWIYEPNQRIDIIQLVDFLRDAVQENRGRERLLHMTSEFLAKSVLPVVKK